MGIMINVLFYMFNSLVGISFIYFITIINSFLCYSLRVLFHISDIDALNYFYYFFLFIFLFSGTICFIFYFYLFYLDLNKVIIRLELTNALTLYETNKTIVLRQDRLSTYIYNLENQYLFLDQEMITPYNIFFYKYNNTQLSNLKLLYEIRENKYKFLILLLNFKFFFISFYFYCRITLLFHNSTDSEFLYISKELKQLKDSILDNSSKQESFFIGYIYFEYNKIICSHLTKKKKLKMLYNKLNSLFFVSTVSKEKELDITYLYIKNLNISKKYISIFYESFFFFNRTNPKLLNKYLSMVAEQKIYINNFFL